MQSRTGCRLSFTICAITSMVRVSVLPLPSGCLGTFALGFAGPCALVGVVARFVAGRFVAHRLVSSGRSSS